MKPKTWAVGLSLLGFALLAPLAAAQSDAPQNPPGSAVTQNTAPAPSTLTGTVERVQAPWCRRCAQPHRNTRLMVRSGGRLYAVPVGPRGFLHRRHFRVAQGDQVTITGWAGRRGNVFVARRITRGNRTLALRGPHGRPRWHRGPRWN